MGEAGLSSQRVMVIRVPWGGGGVARKLAARFAARRAREAQAVAHAHLPADEPVFEQLEPRLLMAATSIAFIGSSSVEGIVGSNSFRRPLWHQLNNAGHDVNFVGSKNTNQNGSTPPNPDFDRDNDGRSGWHAHHFLNGRDGVPKLADLLKGKSADGADFTPDIAVIYVGHNDIFNNESAFSTRDEISQIIDVLRADNPNVQIVLGLLHNTLWSTPGYKTVNNSNPNAGIAQLNSLLTTLASSKGTTASPIVIADINSGFDPATMTLDGQHANATGEAWMANRFFQAINSLPGRVLVTPTSGLTTTEAGGKAFFSVQLSKPPTSNVIINLSSSDTSEGTINKTSLTFTPQNWNVAQTVAITGVDDSVRDGDKAYSINLSATVSGDPNYSGVATPNVSVTNIDNEGAIVGTAFLDLNGNGSKDANESGMANVVVFLDLNNNGNINSGEPVRTTSTNGQFTFDNLTSASYVVRVAPPEGYTVSANGNAVYHFDIGGGQVSTANFALAVIPGQVLLTPAALETTEAGGTASFNVTLSKAPTSNVTVNLASSDTTEGTINKTTLTFTPQNWNVAQTVTITGVDDAVLDGHKAYKINVSTITSADPAFQGIAKPSVNVTNRDNEAAIAGVLYFDANGNGSRDSGETLLANATVFLDANGNGQRDPGELAATTDSQGRYSFAVLPAGLHNVRAVAPAGYINAPGNGAAIVAPGGVTTTRDFALVKPTDTAGDTLATARNLGLATPQQNIDEYLTTDDRVDLYRIRIKKAGRLRIMLKGIDADARVQLLDKAGRRIRRNAFLRQADRKINASRLNRGVYFIRVVSRDGLDTPYRLRMIHKPLA